MLTKDGLELSIATQLARKNLGDLDVTVSIDGFVDLCRLAIKGFDTPLPYVPTRMTTGFQWPRGTRPVYVERLNGDVAINDDIEDAPMIVVSGLNGVSAKAWLEHLFELAAKGQQT